MEVLIAPVCAVAATLGPVDVEAQRGAVVGLGEEKLHVFAARAAVP